MPIVPKDFQEFEQMFRRVREAKAENRVNAVGLLTPQIIRRAIEQKQDIVLQYGRRGAYVHYTVEDLKRFVKFRRGAQKEFGVGDAGVPVSKLIAASLKADIQRANREIRSAVLYRISTSVLHFRTNAGPKSKYTHHQVRIRLDQWSQEMIGGQSYKDAVKSAVNGRVSIDCDCGRYQFWYRYLATVGEFALAPFEKDFPKIRNPELVGCCCKHILRCLNTIRTPGIQAVLVKEMERQASLKGFHGTGKFGSRLLGKSELRSAARSVSTKDIDKEEARKEYDKYLRAQKAFKQKYEELKATMNRERREFDQELAAEKAKSKALKARADSLQKENAELREKLAQYEQKAREAQEVDEDRKFSIKSMSEDFRVHIDAGEMTLEEAVDKIAKFHGVNVEQVRAILGETGAGTKPPGPDGADARAREAEARAQEAERQLDEERDEKARIQSEAEAKVRQAIKGSLMMFAPLIASGAMERDAVLTQVATINNLPLDVVEGIATEAGI